MRCGGRSSVRRAMRSAGRIALRERLAARKTTALRADGEVVWACRLDAGVKSCRGALSSTGSDKSFNPQGDGGKRARSPGRVRSKPLKPLRAGMPGDFGVLVVTRVPFTTTKCTRDRGCIVRPEFPTPSDGRELMQRLGRVAPRGVSACRDRGTNLSESVLQSLRAYAHTLGSLDLPNGLPLLDPRNGGRPKRHTHIREQTVPWDHCRASRSWTSRPC